MKLIAARSFRNTHEIEIEGGAAHPRHIHKGAIFSIGGDAPLEKLKKGDQDLIAQWNAAGCIADANNAEHVKAIRAEAALEEKQEKAAAQKPATPVK